MDKTTGLQIPYSLATDFVRDSPADVSRPLADRLEAILPAELASYTLAAPLSVTAAWPAGANIAAFANVRLEARQHYFEVTIPMMRSEGAAQTIVIALRNDADGALMPPGRFAGFDVPNMSFMSCAARVPFTPAAAGTFNLHVIWGVNGVNPTRIAGDTSPAVFSIRRP